MRHNVLASACLITSLIRAQSPVGFQSVIDPPGDNSYYTFVDGLVAPDGEICVLLGYQNIQEPAFVLSKYDVGGQLLWSRKVDHATGAAQLDPAKVVRVSTGDLFVFGSLATGGGDGYFITRLSPAGEVQWTRTYRQDNTGNDYGFSSIVATTDNELVMSMGLIDRTVAVRVDMDGDLLWSRRYMTDLTPTDKNPGFDFTATADGGVLLTEKAQEDIFLVRLDAEGGVIWTARYPDLGYCQTHVALLLEDGGFLIAGSRDTHPFAARLDATGYMVWMKEYAIDEGIVDLFDHAMELPDGDLLLTPSWNSSGIMALRLTPLGAPLYALTLDGDGYAAVLGQHDGLIVFGGRAFMELDGGFEDAILLIGTDAGLGLDCLQGSTGATATTITSPLPVQTWEVVDEPIIEGEALMEVSSPLIGTRALCGTVDAVNGPMASPLFTVSPTLVVVGQQLILEGPGSRMRVELIMGDGRIRPLPGVDARGQNLISTAGWAPGPYALRATGDDGVLLGLVRVIVQ